MASDVHKRVGTRSAATFHPVIHIQKSVFITLEQTLKKDRKKRRRESREGGTTAPRVHLCVAKVSVGGADDAQAHGKSSRSSQSRKDLMKRTPTENTWNNNKSIESTQKRARRPVTKPRPQTVIVQSECRSVSLWTRGIEEFYSEKKSWETKETSNVSLKVWRTWA